MESCSDSYHYSSDFEDETESEICTLYSRSDMYTHYSVSGNSMPCRKFRDVDSEISTHIDDSVASESARNFAVRQQLEKALKLSQKQNRKLKQQINQRDAKFAEINQLCIKKDLTIRKAKKMLDAAKAEVVEFSRKNQQLETELELIKSKFMKNRKENKELKKEITEFNTKIAKFNANFMKNEELKKEVEEKHTKLTGKLRKEVEAVFHRTRIEVDQACVTLQKKDSEIESLYRVIGRQENQIRSIRRDRNLKKNEFVAKLNEDLINRNKKYEEENRAQLKLISEQETKILTLEAKMNPRVCNKFLMGSPMLALLFVVLYLKFVLDWGQRFMKDRKPYNVDKLLIVYNIIQIVWNLTLFIKAFRYTYGLGGYSFICEPVDTSQSEAGMIIADGCHSYTMIKFFDCLDTVFFVLRKKTKQISFLHVYHHAGILAIGWAACRVYPGGQTIFTGFVNTFIHVIMYSYYLYAILNPDKKNIWWKKYLTQLQIIQFFLISSNFIALTVSADCGYPKWTAFYIVPQNVFIMAMFIDFYIKTYCKKKEIRK